MRKYILSFTAIIILSLVSSSAFSQSPQIPPGLTWLYSAQTPSGNWPQVVTTDYYSTAAVLDAVSILNSSSSAYTLGFQWLSGQLVTPTDYISRQIIARKRAGLDASAELSNLLLYHNSDGGFGGADGYPNSYILDTALALQALRAANYSDTTLIGQSLSYLTNNQNTDSGWGFTSGDTSNAYVTAVTLRALAAFSSQFSVQSSISMASAYLLTKQNMDGGFGSSPSNVYETALSVMSLIESGQGSMQQLQNAIAYLTSAQSSNGS